VNTNALKLFAALLILANSARAVSFGAALVVMPKRSETAGTTAATIMPRAVSFRDVPGRGLLARVWINSVGPFDFAIDTGAGSTLLSERVVAEAHVNKSRRSNSISGLSGVPISAREAGISRMAIGDDENTLPGRGSVMVTAGLPSGVDGVLDPTEAFAPLGYTIDLPHHELAAFDPSQEPVKTSDEPDDGAVVSWLRESRGRRPFVLLSNGERALLDTGSNLGFAIRDRGVEDQRNSGYVIRDIGGGRVSAHRVSPTTISIGSLTLRKVPTDVISGAEADAPVLLGLSALRPFRIRFDPAHHLIEIAPSVRR
jgi:Aspartyl protease